MRKCTTTHALCIIACFALCQKTCPQALGPPGSVVSYPGIRSVSFGSQVLATSSQFPVTLEVAQHGSLVVVDPKQKKLLVSNSQTGALQIESSTGLDTPYAHTQCKGVNTTLVSFARRAVIQAISEMGPQLDFTSAFAADPRALVSDMAAAADCSVVYVLDGVQKKIFVVRPSQPAELFVTMAILVEPVGLHFLEKTQELLIADWGGGAIYSVSVAFASTRLLRRVAGTGAQGLIADTAGSSAAVLSGPTQFSDFEKGRVLFTDRNPFLNTSAVRALHVAGPQRGAVTTISGGNYRGQAGGGPETMSFSGIWGVAFNAANKDILVAEPVAGTVRRLFSVEFTFENCSDGEAPSALAWDGGECTLCPVGFFCSDGSVHGCAGNATSTPGAVSPLDCWCGAGTFSDAEEMVCKLCPPNHFCPPFSDSPMPCADGLVSEAGAGESSDCHCMDGWFNTAGGCSACPSGSYCAGGARVACPAHSESYSGAVAISNCTCVGGYIQQGGDAFECVKCAEGMDCSPGTVRIEALGVVQAPVQFDLVQLIDARVIKRRVAEILGMPLSVVQVNSEFSVTRVAGAVAVRRSRMRRLLQILNNSIWDLLLVLNLGAMDIAEVERYLSSLRYIFSSASVLGPIIEEATGGVVDKDSIMVNVTFTVLTLNSGDNNTACESSRGRVLYNGVCVCMLGYSPASVSSCVMCAEGKYSDVYTRGFSYECKPCPVGLTSEAGATALSACVCPRGKREVQAADGEMECSGDGGSEDDSGAQNSDSNIIVIIGAAAGGGALLCILTILWFGYSKPPPQQGDYGNYGNYRGHVAGTGALFQYLKPGLTPAGVPPLTPAKSLFSKVLLQAGGAGKRNGIKGKRQ